MSGSKRFFGAKTLKKATFNKPALPSENLHSEKWSSVKRCYAQMAFIEMFSKMTIAKEQ